MKQRITGISATDRFERRLQLSHYLLKLANFSRFPYKTKYIGGIPVITNEALLVYIDRKNQIYQFLKNQTGYMVITQDLLERRK